MSTLTQPRPRVKPATRPVHGRARWAVQPGTGKFPHPGVLVIVSEDARGKPNVATFIVEEYREAGALTGYRLLKADGAMYDLPVDLSSCDCPDHTYHPERPGGCRHMRALKAALAALAL